MANKIKGLTIEFGGDTTKLGKALDDVNNKSRDLSSELGEVNRLLKMDPGNADLLAQKQKILSEAVENTAKKLDTLKEAERQVQAQFERGEVSEEQVRALKREIEATEQKLNGYKNAVKETADEVDNLGKRSKASADELNDFANRGLATVGGLVTAASGALVAAAESTREYRTEMGKLDTAFTDNGHSAESARAAYQELQGILGETEQSVEAANHLAKLTDNEKDLATWTGDILPGVFATFGASLPIEGLTEAANETAKVGQITGPMADAINWATTESAAWTQALSGNSDALAAFEAAAAEGLSAEDAFNAALAECSTEQERQALITQTLSSIYGDASQAYKETNADVIAANQANEAWTASLAQVGAAVEPVLTDVKNIGAELLGKLVPAITAILDNLPAVAVALAGITAALVSYKVAAIAATAAEKGMTLAQYAAAAAQKVLNAAMLSNPIGLVILAITGLVTAFMVLWKNSDGFRNFWINLWENVKTAAANAITAVKNFFVGIIDFVKSNWQSLLLLIVNPFAGAFKLLWDNCEGFREFWTELWEKVKSAAASAIGFFQEFPAKMQVWLTDTITRVTAWTANMAAKAVEAGTKFVQNVVTFVQELPYNLGYLLGQAIGTVARWVVDTANKAKEAGTKFVTNFINFVKNLPANLQTWLTSALSRAKTWATNMAASAKTAATNMLNNAVNTLKNLPGRVYSAISGAIQRVVSWGASMVSSAKTAASNMLTSAVNTLKNMPARVYSAIQSAISKVQTWGTNMASRAKTAATNVVNSVYNTLKNLPSKVLSIGGDLVTGLWNGITNKASWLLGKIKSFASGILDGIKDAFGVHSPAESSGNLKTTDYVGEMLDEGLANGLLDNARTPLQAMKKVSGSVLDAATQPVDGLSLTRTLSRPVVASAAPVGVESGLGAKLDRILEAIERGQVLMIDGDALVGATANKMDNKLGQRRALAARGAV